MQGDVGEWGKIGDKGGGETVDDCSQCANICSAIETCGSYECSPTELKCNLNTETLPTNVIANKDYMFCSKKDSSKTAALLLSGWKAKYFKIPDYVRNIPDMTARVE